MDFSQNIINNDVLFPSTESMKTTSPLDKLKQPEVFLGKNDQVELCKLTIPEDWGKLPNVNFAVEGSPGLTDAKKSDTETTDLESGEESKDLKGNKESESSEKSQEAEVKKIKCINEDYCGKKHPDTGVPYVEKIVEDANGEKVRVVAPVFDSDFDAQLPEDKLQSKDREQFKECNKQLKEKIKEDPELAKKFTPEQLEQIENGDTPDGYTWHHHEEKGKMQLVDTEVHNDTRHTGGKAIWGGGKKNRN